MEFSLYWFMSPVSIAVATTAMLSGIGGAALFMPIFLLVLPLLGADYIIGSAVAAITVALLTQTFGFASGFVSYYQKRLIDFQQAKPFLLLSVPAAITGVIIGGQIVPRLQGKVEAATMQATIGFLFGIIGIAMLATVAIHIINSGGRLYSRRRSRLL